MNRKDFSFLHKIFPDDLINKISAVVINQCTEFLPEHTTFNFSETVKVYNTTEKGLSRSRNLALKYANADICVLCDDDFTYLSDCLEKIEKAYNDIPDADIITFQSLGTQTGKKRKEYKEKLFKYKLYQLSSVSSSDITFKLTTVKHNKLQFDEKFGLGTSNYSGEEGIFLADAFRLGLNIYHYPAFIVKTTEISTGSRLILDPYMRGKIYKRLLKKPYLYFLVFLYTSFKQMNIYKNKFSFLNYIKSMINGAKSL
jgi:glycosyltransferase involved in cell wall biosynthesis